MLYTWSVCDIIILFRRSIVGERHDYFQIYCVIMDTRKEVVNFISSVKKCSGTFFIFKWERLPNKYIGESISRTKEIGCGSILKGAILPSPGWKVKGMGNMQIGRQLKKKIRLNYSVTCLNWLLNNPDPDMSIPKLTFSIWILYTDSSPLSWYIPFRLGQW